MNAELLLKIAERLDTVPPAAFDFGCYVDVANDKAIDAPSPALGDCGTSACALGWAATIPECQDRGLHLVPEDGGIELEGPGGEDPATWAMRELGLSTDELGYLFMPEGCREATYGGVDGRLPPSASAATVAAHIRAFVERGGIP